VRFKFIYIFCLIISHFFSLFSQEPTVFSGVQEAQEIQEKYKKTIEKYCSDEYYEKISQKVKEISETYTDEYIDKILDRENSRQREQLEFNNKALFDLPIIKTPDGNPISFRNKDLMISGFLIAEWLLDYWVYRSFIYYVSQVISNFCLAHKEKVSENTFYKSLSEDLNIKIKRYLFGFLFFYVPVIITQNALKSHLMLTPQVQWEIGDSLARYFFSYNNQGGSVKSLPGFFDYFGGKKIAGIPLPVVHSTGIDIISGVLYNYDLVPEISKTLIWKVFVNISFFVSFLFVIYKYKFSPGLENYFVSQAKEISLVLYDSTYDKKTLKEFFIKNIKKECKFNFAVWVSTKQLVYTWGRTLELAIVSLPIVINILKIIYKVNYHEESK
jgi:hypothetical protein